MAGRNLAASIPFYQSIGKLHRTIDVFAKHAKIVEVNECAGIAIRPLHLDKHLEKVRSDLPIRAVETALISVKIKTMRVLAIDASLRHTGVAIVDKTNGRARAIFYGTIHNAGSLKSSACLVAIREQLAQLIHEHEPDCCALEAVIYVQSYKTAILLGAARGAAILAAAESGLPVFEYAPTRIKQSTVGTGAAAKNQVAFMIRALLELRETPDTDSADALAIALTHIRAQETQQLGIPSGTEI